VLKHLERLRTRRGFQELWHLFVFVSCTNFRNIKWLILFWGTRPRGQPVASINTLKYTQNVLKGLHWGCFTWWDKKYLFEIYVLFDINLHPELVSKFSDQRFSFKSGKIRTKIDFNSILNIFRDFPLQIVPFYKCL
jgi:hypothetical protein